MMHSDHLPLVDEGRQVGVDGVMPGDLAQAALKSAPLQAEPPPDLELDLVGTSRSCHNLNEQVRGNEADAMLRFKNAEDSPTRSSQIRSRSRSGLSLLLFLTWDSSSWLQLSHRHTQASFARRCTSTRPR